MDDPKPPPDPGPQFWAALAAVAAEIQNPPAVAKNSHFGQPYADLKSVVETVRPVLARHGFAVIQNPTVEHDRDIVWLDLETILAHKSGGVWSSNLRWRAGSNIQHLGAAITYVRRYALCAILNIVGDPDDDAETIVAPTRQEKTHAGSDRRVEPNPRHPGPSGSPSGTSGDRPRPQEPRDVGRA